MANEKKYFLGLDVGTNSVGWAVTDENYNLIKKSGKHLWGARLFGDASTAESRRTNRENRRRLQRRRWRIIMLQEFFEDEIEKIDSSFFIRLNNSSLVEKDKPFDAQLPYTLFNDTYTDRDFYSNYATIYHLRQAMLKEEKKFDLRMIYLALAHMVKYRGHFLQEGDISSSNEQTELLSYFEVLNNLFSSLTEENEQEQIQMFDLTDFDFSEISKAFMNIRRKKELSEKLGEILKIKKSNSDLRSLLLDLISGSSISAAKLFPSIAENNEDLKDIKIEFGSDKFELETLPSLPEKIGDIPAQIILLTKQIFDFKVLTSLLKGHKYISDAMVEIYDNHQKQLKKIKRLIKTYNPGKYNNFFRKLEVKDLYGAKETNFNYAAYVGYNKVKKDKKRTPILHSEDDLKKFKDNIKKLLPFDQLDSPVFVWVNPSDKNDLLEIKKAIDEDTLLPRQNSRNNSVFPHQLNELEMREILERQGKYYPFLLEKAKSFANPNEEDYKIVSILKFKIPYYVGPLTRRNGVDKPKHQWVSFTGEGKIYPWNFHDIIDEKQSAEKFIERMKNSCTYLIGEPTLPKNSLLYSEFILLNEMNNWIINGSPITQEDKQYLITKLYLTKKTVKLKDIKEALSLKYNNCPIHLTTRTGKDVLSDDLHANLKSFITLMNKDAFGQALLTDKDTYEKAEEVINILTILEDKKLILEKLKTLGLSETQVKYIKGLQFKGWGNLSKKVLDGITSEVKDENDEVINLTIIELMRKTHLNFMEILESKGKFDFKKKIDELNTIEDMTPYEMIDNEYASPAMKRAIRQTFRIIEELKIILGINSFDTYFVETTREEEQNKKRTISRKEQLEFYFKAAKNLVDEELSEQLSSQTEESLRKKKNKLYLYFLQLGKSVYTGNPIDLNHLENYDIDHIIPQAIFMDDSINNTVLVEKTLNERKSSLYPIPENCITDKGKEWVKTLNLITTSINKSEQKLLSDEKKDKILRTPNRPLTDDELVGFVNRQLTLTSQSIKAITDILQCTDKNAKIVYCRAKTVKEFRKAFGFRKCREINDFHHANDAYLNIVVGNTYQKVFTSNFTKETLQSRREYFEQTKIDPIHFFKRDQFIFNVPARVWKANKYYFDNGVEHETIVADSSMEIVKKMMQLTDPLVTHMLYTQPGFMNKISIISSHEPMPSSFLPLKKNLDPTLYGCYSDLTTPYFILVKSEGPKKKHIYSLESIPTIYGKSMSGEEKIQYLKDINKLKNPKILRDHILIRSVLKVPGPLNSYSLLGISYKGDNRIGTINLSQLKLPDKYINYICEIFHLITNDDNSYIQNTHKYDDLKEIKRNKTYLNSNNNIELFDYLTSNIFNRPCFSSLPGLNGFFEKLKAQRDMFCSLGITLQFLLLAKVIKVLNCKSIREDFSMFNLSKAVGAIRISKNLTAGTKIIQQSITGFYEKVVFVVPED